MELAGLSRDPDPTLVRHIYDLHLMQGHIDPVQVAALARDIAAADAQEFRNQYPAYAADIAGETRKALDALRTDPATAHATMTSLSQWRMARGRNSWRR